jgi:hypothetical protein
MSKHIATFVLLGCLALPAHGTNHNKRNAFGKCVSQHARA